jgi:hypothetical protein
MIEVANASSQSPVFKDDTVGQLFPAREERNQEPPDKPAWYVKPWYTPLVPRSESRMSKPCTTPAVSRRDRYPPPLEEKATTGREDVLNFPCFRNHDARPVFAFDRLEATYLASCTLILVAGRTRGLFGHCTEIGAYGDVARLFKLSYVGVERELVIRSRTARRLKGIVLDRILLTKTKKKKCENSFYHFLACLKNTSGLRRWQIRLYMSTCRSAE